MFLKPEFGLLFWMLLCFGAVFFVLAKYGFPVILKMVNDRKAYIDRSLDAARDANNQLAQIKTESEAILAMAQKEQVTILTDAASTRDRIVEEAREQARVEGAKELEIIRQQIRQEKEAAIKDIRRQVAVLSVDIAEKVLREKLGNQADQLKLIDRLLDETMISKS